uniref:Uncharacterized protein n=1 Tax=Globisporangium ultimum (strain ATCC 200006 / CBS 805.95 / DAOM BR144) TaxID=431595 RepID=K3WX68_GLOUD
MRAAPTEKYTHASATTAGARQWSFQTMLVTSGASELETATTSELLKLIASDAQLSSWTRRCSYRVVSRNDVEALIRRMKVEQLLAAQTQLERDRDAAAADKEEDVETEANDAQDQTLGAASISPPTAENASLAGSNSQKAMLTTSEGVLPTLEENLVMTPQLLAAAFQRLVLDDKKEFTEFIAANEALSSSPPEDEQQAEFSISSKGDELTSSSSDSTRSSSTDFLSALPAREGAPARIYFLTEYPSSLAEMHALLHTKGAGTIVQDELSLLPLIDGVLLLLDPIKELQSRRKSISLPNDRRKSVSQKNIAGLERKFSLVGVDSMDELEKLNPATVGPCVFQTVNHVVREWYDAASVGGLEWSDFVFMDLSVPQQAATKEFKVLVELVTDMLTSTETLAAQKREFKAWVSTVKVISIPKACLGSEDEGDDETSKTLTMYEQILAPVYEASVGVSTVLFAMKEAIACFGEGSDNIVLSQSNDDNQSYMEEFLTHSDNAALRLAVAYTTFIMQQQRHNNNSSNTPNPRCILGAQIDAVEKDMWSHSDLPGVGNRGRKGMPVTPLVAPADRSVRDTELAQFSSLDVAQVHLTQQLLQFEELLGSPWKGKLQSSWRFVEHLDRPILPQRLAQILSNFPAIHKHYDASTDSLLLATLAATAPGRFRTTRWTAKHHVRHRVAFKDWKKEQLVPDEYLTPRTLSATGACVPLSSAELSLLTENTSVLFPSDQSVVRVYQTPRGYTWLNVYHHS